MPGTDSEPCSQLLHALSVQRTVMDEPECPAHGGRSAEPRRRAGRCFRPATQAGPETRLGRSSGAGEIFDVLLFRRRCRADRPAIDAGGGHADEETPVEAWVPRQASSIA